MIWLFILVIAIAAGGIVFARRLPTSVLIGLGAVIVLIGIIAIAILEWRYAGANNRPLDIPIALGRAGQIETPTFTVGQGAPYDLWLQTDRAIGIAAFGCLTGEPDFEALCPGRVPVLDLAWTADENGIVVARGGSDFEGWRRRQAALDPRLAAKKLASFRAYAAKEAADPSNQWPLFHRLGSFNAVGGKTYRLTLVLKAPVPQLAALHPRLTVGLGGDATRGLGTMVIWFGLLCVIGGGLMLLIARARLQRKTPS
jgi:hypothetical protein